MMRGIILHERTALLFATCLVACCVAVFGDESTRAAPRDDNRQMETPSGEPQPPTDVVNEHVVSQIEQIRRRLGTNPFRGTIFDDAQPAAPKTDDPPSAGGTDLAAESEFDAAIRAVAAQRASRNPSPDRSALFGASHLPPIVQVDPASTLRQAARSLEDEAADLDDVGLYSEADLLRGVADQFWQKARQIERPPETESQTP